MNIQNETEAIAAARLLLKERWDQHGACQSCGWHAFLSEHDVDDFEIEEAIESDGILRLTCLNKDDEERHTHRGVSVPISV